MRELDYGVGEILKQVSKLGLTNNTFVFFSSDNGAAKISGPRGWSHLCYFNLNQQLRYYFGLCI